MLGGYPISNPISTRCTQISIPILDPILVPIPNAISQSNPNLQVGLGYQQKLRDGVTVTLSALVNGGALGQGGHKVGMALEFAT